ncbi:MAG: glycosyltransferase family 9 protein [Bacillota bacterium]
MLFSLLNVFRRKNKKAAVKNVLVVELFEMGAAVMAYPAIRFVQKKLQDVNIYCLCTDSVRQSWEILNVLPRENILSIKSGNLLQFAASLLRKIWRLRSAKIDLAIDFELFMRISSIIVFLTGARYKAGFHRYEHEGLYRGSFYDYRVAFNQNMHITRNYLALVMTALYEKIDYPNYKAGINLPEEDLPVYHSQNDVREAVERKIRTCYPDFQGRQLILLSPDVGKNLSVRNYPKENYVAVVKKILAVRPSCLFLLIGVKENEKTCAWIAGMVNDERCVDFCSRTASLQELLELMSMSALLIGNDNGPLHFASMTSCRILGLFSTDSPYVYGPVGKCVILYRFFHCSPCISAYNHKKSRCVRNLCLETLEPSLVSDFALRLLDEKLKYHTINNETPYLF